MVLIGSSLWGVSGTASQKIFEGYHISPGWLVDVRMGVSGIVLLAIVGFNRLIGRARRREFRSAAPLFAVWKNPRDAIHLVLFAILGLYLVQFSYLTSIQRGNAAMATFLQYLGPAFVLIYATWRAKRLPTRWENLALALAVVGTLLLVTNGSWGKIVVPADAVVWGLISAITLALYTVSPVRLIHKYGSAAIVGWAMLIGAIVSCIQTPPWRVPAASIRMNSLLLIGFVVLLGTLLAFYLYLASTNYITPTETSLIACMEPLSAALASVLWLHTRLGVATVIGGLCILGTVIVLARKSRSVANVTVAAATPTGAAE